MSLNVVSSNSISPFGLLLMSMTLLVLPALYRLLHRDGDEFNEGERVAARAGK